MLTYCSWSLDRVHEPGFERVKPRFDVVKDWHQVSDWYSYDDEVVINTQSGSQWDGLRTIYMILLFPNARS